jgi:hypothetical protein
MDSGGVARRGGVAREEDWTEMRGDRDFCRDTDLSDADGIREQLI